MHLKEYIFSCLKEYYEKYDEIPKNFSWVDKSEIPSIKNFLGNKDYENIKKNISKPKNQNILGVCWAISFANAVNDAFLIKKIIDWNPNISITYILSKLPNAGDCTSGSIMILGLYSLLYDIGFASESCIDYSWCSGNRTCGRTIFKKTSEKTMAKFNKHVSSPGCYNDKVKKYSYKISSIKSLSWENFHVDLKILNRTKTIINFVKIHILMRSPVIIAFPVFSNFYKSFWKDEKTNGVYIENDSLEIKAFHSMTIVGWGYTNIKGKKSLYWIYRNSWGEKWGEGGYCKVAGYPHNKWCCPEYLMKFEKNPLYSTYLLFIDVNEYPELITYPKAVFEKANFYLTRPLEYYNTDENLLVHKDIFEENYNETITDCFKIPKGKNCIKVRGKFPE